MDLRKLSVCLLPALSTVALVLSPAAAAQEPEPPPTAAPAVKPAAAPDPCVAVCYAYRQGVRIEREAAAKDGYPVYLSPLDGRVVVRVRHAGGRRPDLSVPVADELYLAVNDTQVWRVKAPSVPPGGGAKSFGREILQPGPNVLELKWAGSSSGEAHFVADLGGTAFCPDDGWCRQYAEGRTFGSGVVERILTKDRGRGVVNAAKVWRSRLESPNSLKGLPCSCRDPE